MTINYILLLFKLMNKFLATKLFCLIYLGLNHHKIMLCMSKHIFTKLCFEQTNTPLF